MLTSVFSRLHAMYRKLPEALQLVLTRPHDPIFSLEQPNNILNCKRFDNAADAFFLASPANNQPKAVQPPSMS